ncbi:MAG TPA: efflux RND transporter periplasmic adaptor subunit [Xanthomonadales bacterium]|nr:efflux RND transporter periplasmic adaptor subunit [Xanthomonadales bacterium]
MKKFLKFAAPLLVVVAAVVVAMGLTASKPPPDKKEDELRLVSLYVEDVKSESVLLHVETQGEVRPKTEIELVSQVAGRVVHVASEFAEGAEFNPNTTLIKIDDTDYKFAVTRAEAQVAAAKTILERELANAEIKRDEWKVKKSDKTPTPFALNEPQVEEARAMILSAEAQLAEARVNLARTNIKVPFQGRVRVKDVGLGQYVTPGESLGTVFSTDTIEIRLPLTDTQLFELGLPLGFVAESRESAPAVTLRASVGQRDYNWKGRIVRTQAAVDRETRLIYAFAEVEDPYSITNGSTMPLAVGLFVTAEIDGSAVQQAFTIPRLALRKDDEVYVINDEERLEIRKVDVLSTSEERVVLAGGVEAGEQVVTSTIPAAVDGMQVQAVRKEETLASSQ